MKKERDSNFELLRCVLMYMVLVLHYNTDFMGKAFLYVTPGTINYYLLNLAECLVIVGTNGFVLMSGYFSWKSNKMSLRKPIGLLIYVVAYNVLFYMINVIVLQQPFSIISLLFNFVPRNWYISLYVALMLLSPYINIVIRKLDKKSYMTLLGIMFVLFSVWSTILDVGANVIGLDSSGMSFVTLVGAADGYTIVNFVFLYFIGAAISKFDLLKHEMKWDVLAYLALTVLMFVQQMLVGAAWSYSNPIVILSCVAFFNIFRKMHVKSKIINTFAKATLGVFMIHTQYIVCGLGWELCNIEKACQGSVVGLAIHMLLCCFVTFVVCAAFDMFCRYITRPVSKWLNTIPFLNRTIVEIEEN